ncbi:MAG TPA: hypothetical protein VND43_02685 [Burkholderiales bacterium]|nr:hypothetical protein [Burkholderiales bacterium]
MRRSALACMMISFILCGCATMANPDHLASGSSAGVIVGITRTVEGSNLSYGTVSGLPGISWSPSHSSSQKGTTYTITVRLANGSTTTVIMDSPGDYKVGDRVILEDNGIRRP